MSVLRQWLKSTLSMSLPRSWLLTHGPRRALAGAPIKIALTFDDGPHPEHTARLLDLLAATGTRGTFFVIGELAERYPHLIKRIAEAGHQLGNHTWTHSEPSQTPVKQFLDEVQRTSCFLQDLTGHACQLMRPPKGNLSIGKALGLWRQRQTIALWNVDPKDFQMPDSQAMHRWLAGYAPKDGDIVLLHDDHSCAATCVERLTSSAQGRYRFVTISQWLSSADPASVV